MDDFGGLPLGRSLAGAPARSRSFPFPAPADRSGTDFGLVQDQWLCLTYIGGVVLLLAYRPEWTRRLAPVGLAGRMALTNYLVQAAVLDVLARATASASGSDRLSTCPPPWPSSAWRGRQLGVARALPLRTAGMALALDHLRAAAAALPELRMRARHLYLALCLIGTLLPLGAFLPFLGAPGTGPRLFVQQLFATPVSAFFGWDVIVSSLVLWTFVLVEGRRLALRRLWAPILANLLVGVSLGLPLFLIYGRFTWRERATIPPETTMTTPHPIPLTAIAAVLLSGCAAGMPQTSSSSAMSERERDCSFRSATTCWTLAPRVPASRAAPRDSVPDQLLTPPRPVLAARADSAASP